MTLGGLVEVLCLGPQLSGVVVLSCAPIALLSMACVSFGPTRATCGLAEEGGKEVQETGAPDVRWYQVRCI